ncbi:UDP-N-acetylmuramoyl-L-alanyl-D-glutamate--2,6-diaminopimelate ligase [Corynebacterium lizhenjunii]|uniref:UDP-N-acetylmuramoyl-L-alanyl-D-glutamate--2,6-diaminopimelate ligase n=1 Tax=Corynebacterium lizhenjunii TaxID=2709394 RepID=A0A7T0P988_9CORY|nr:UDP-N-acetylmuramoyl-L-alanyl-D-glutamate--2,6-diaminopimelate ligase [Corynebacterium lizhenjunii]QPK78508.1 UDP-N-acetylmuramoyl-L-alanyl-D-glutamate--2,6-diaminopimelate ligase [Corynebacterium lizhenjunii]
MTSSSFVSLGRLAQLAGAQLSGAVDSSSIQISSISLDSAAVAPGGLFAALPGTRVHGAQFAAQTPAAAILSDAAGAQLLSSAGETRPVLIVDDVRAVLGHLAAEIYGHPTADMTVIGITGTSGKTTTSYLVEEGLLHAGYSVGLIGTTGTRINREPVATKLTTPEAPRLQELFATMRAQGVTHVVMEVSSHALALGRVQGVRFAAGAFTNLSQDHLDFHSSMEEYFDAKATLFSGPDSAQHAVVCVDESWGQRMAERVDGALTTVASASTDADLCATQLDVEATGAQRVVLRGVTSGTDLEFRLPLPGRFNIANAAVAVGLASAVGVDLDAFVHGIEQVRVPGRMERIELGQDFLAVVDYAHKPAAVSAVLETLRGQVGKQARIAVVVGAGGDRDAAKRPLMGAGAARGADLVIVTDDNPRSEDPAAIRAAVVAGAVDAGTAAEIREIGSRAQAIDTAVAWAQPGDAVIVVGKGHEVGQIVGEQTIHFDDREELARAVRARTGAAKQ